MINSCFKRPLFSLDVGHIIFCVLILCHRSWSKPEGRRRIHTSARDQASVRFQINKFWKVSRWLQLNYPDINLIIEHIIYNQTG